VHQLVRGAVLCRPGTTPSRPAVGTGWQPCLPAEFKKLRASTKQALRDVGLWFCAQESLCEQEVVKQQAMLLGGPWPGGSRRVPTGSGEPLRLCRCWLHCAAGLRSSNCRFSPGKPRGGSCRCLGSQRLPQHFPISCLIERC